MGTFLFNEIIFGPVSSRRLGVSLGINLLPTDYKFCTFNCVYCECGWTLKADKKIKLPTTEEVKNELEKVLEEYADQGKEINSITFAGNGEPTIHPDFAQVIDDTIELRNLWMPEANISVLSNASQLNKTKVTDALKKIDQNILKLDAGTEETYRLINMAQEHLKFDKIVDYLKSFQGNLIIQTLFIRGSHNGKSFDNTTEEEVNAWLQLLKEIQPESVMLYPIERDTPAESLEKVSQETLERIAAKVEAIGIKTDVY
ncbi:MULTISPECIES: radical SAM protein [unclassified Lentimicrobium]|uniref:radical SAM protein n=1 Tax=unclassified Lentimicrobium TaxID=2677434 RepID=UPI00155778FB|nr:MULTISPECIES: radical SAM protein [unclassified Lentimicrobium]NPD45646.1 radical SAM protein [Lentimicrobium sp. S6]NPD86419.1 radical SAM protein [Lentimicrobium sp. L6]